MKPETFSRFMISEDGAVTVDWVVLTAAIVGLGMATMAVVSAGVESLSNDTAGQLAEIDAGDMPFGALARNSSGWGSFGLVNALGYDEQHFENWAATGIGDGSGQQTADQDVLDRYNYAVGGLDTWGDRGDAVDAIGALEAEMQSRGMELPGDAPRYADLVGSYQS